MSTRKIRLVKGCEVLIKSAHSVDVFQAILPAGTILEFEEVEEEEKTFGAMAGCGKGPDGKRIFYDAKEEGEDPRRAMVMSHNPYSHVYKCLRDGFDVSILDDAQLFQKVVRFVGEISGATNGSFIPILPGKIIYKESGDCKKKENDYTKKMEEIEKTYEKLKREYIRDVIDAVDRARGEHRGGGRT